jgi:DNA-binding NarL/FixJ family response regulator
MMRLAEKYMENSNEFWSKEDNERLTRMFYEGKGVSEMALELGRSERTVMHQLNVLKLYGYKNSKRTRDDEGICLCTRCQKYAACELRKLADPSRPVPCMQQ